MKTITHTNPNGKTVQVNVGEHATIAPGSRSTIFQALIYQRKL